MFTIFLLIHQSLLVSFKGRLLTGDLILDVNGENLIGVTNERYVCTDSWMFIRAWNVIHGLFWTLSMTDWKSTTLLKSLEFNWQVIYPINLIQQNCCGKVKDFICFYNTRNSWFLSDTDYRMCVKIAEAVKI